MESKKTFGEYLAQKRKEAGLTQKAFGEKLYVSESAVSKWERGLSYPDISLIKDICGVLGVSEHELLTASEDTATRRNEKLANKYLRLVRRIRWTQIIIYGAAILTCFICNLAIQHTLSWFFIVLAAVLTSASLTLLPTLVEKHRGLITLAGFTLSLLLLLLVCSLYTGGSWFPIASVSVLFGLCVVFLPVVVRQLWLPEKLGRHTALICMAVDTLLLFLLLFVSDLTGRGGWFVRQGIPLAGFWLLLPWGMLLIIRYTTINRFFKAAACAALVGLFAYIANGFIAWVVGDKSVPLFPPFDFSRWNADTLDGNLKTLILIISGCLALILFVIGLMKALPANKEKAQLPSNG